MPSLNTFQAVREVLSDENPEALLWDGLETALIGIARRCGQPTLAVYDYELCIEALRSDGMTYEDAVEYVEHNVVGGWLGEHTPVMLDRRAVEVLS